MVTAQIIIQEIDGAFQIVQHGKPSISNPRTGKLVFEQIIAFAERFISSAQWSHEDQARSRPDLAQQREEAEAQYADAKTRVGVTDPLARVCPICFRIFKDGIRFVDHIGTVHRLNFITLEPLSIRPSRSSLDKSCPICAKRYSMTANLRNHIEQVHGMDPETMLSAHLIRSMR